jgi:FMN-dependent NADH-azoreductase
MNTLLRIDSSSRTSGSHSRDLGDYFEEVWLGRNPEDLVVRRDVVAEPIDHISERTIAGFYTPAERFTDELRAATALSDRLISELSAADVLLLTVPMYNFSIPSALKAWIDHVVRIRHTFSYDGASFEGLLSGRRAYVISAHGAGGYAEGEPLATANFVTPYLSLLMDFLGIHDVRTFSIETTMGDETAVAASLDRVKREIGATVAEAAEEAA